MRAERIALGEPNDGEGPVAGREGGQLKSRQSGPGSNGRNDGLRQQTYRRLHSGYPEDREHRLTSTPTHSGKMYTAARWFRLVFGFLFVGGVLITSPRAAAQPADSSVTPDRDTHSNRQPYATDRSIAYHVLASPAYVLHGVTRPLGWGVRYVEQSAPALFTGERPPRGVLPLFELGGPTGFQAGLALYDNHFFGSDQKVRVEGLYGGPNTFETSASYVVPTPFGPGTRFDLNASYFSDPSRTFFLGGNASEDPENKGEFERDQIDVKAGIDVAPPDRAVRGEFDLLYEHVDALRGDGRKGERLDRADPPGLGTIDLLTSRVTFGLDRTRGRPRTYAGTEVLLRLDYSQDLTADRFRYGRYVAEVRQYLPVGFFPNSRRLALRGRLEQTEPLFDGEAIPFYQLPSLGGQNMLRGFPSNRFQGKGSLVLNAEYRYPVWSNWDAVVFVDSGQVFPELSDVAADRFQWSYGGGLHMLNQKGLSFRFEVAGSPEGVRTILTVDPTFRRLGR